jgi:hypothetical protein
MSKSETILLLIGNYNGKRMYQHASITDAVSESEAIDVLKYNISTQFFGNNKPPFFGSPAGKISRIKFDLLKTTYYDESDTSDDVSGK